jgi:hypothetical protein
LKTLSFQGFIYLSGQYSGQAIVGFFFNGNAYRSGETKFSEIIVGLCEQLLEHKSALNALLSEELCMLISEDNSHKYEFAGMENS